MLLPRQASGPCRVVLVDDRPLLRAAVSLALAREDLAVVATCDQLADLTKATWAPGSRPDVVVLSNGVTSLSRHHLRELKDDTPDVSVVVVADTVAEVTTLYEARLVDAVLGPHAGVEHLRRVVHRVCAGERLIVALGSPTVENGHKVALTEREHDVLQLLAGGASNDDISTQLGISVNTVRSHVQTLFRKLGQSRRIGAVRRAEELGLLDRLRV